MWYISRENERSIQMEDLKPTIARNIAALRQQAGMTQAGLAEALHYSDKAVSKWERGESIPDVSVLKQIADMFHVTVDDLLSDGKAEKAEPAVQPVRGPQPRTRRLIAAITLMGVAALALLMLILLRTWLIGVYVLPVAAIVWLVFNSLWFDRKRNFLIVSVLMWTVLLCVCATLAYFHLPRWEVMLLGLPGQAIVWLCSRFGTASETQKEE